MCLIQRSFVILLPLFFATTLLAQPTTRPPSIPAADWDLAHWVQWRDEQITYILEPTFTANGEILLLRDEVIRRSAAAFTALEPLITADPNFFAITTERGKAMANFVSFIKGQRWMALQDASGQATHALGMEISDKDYVTYAEAMAQLPPLLKSQEFLKDMSSPATYKAASDMIEAANVGLPDNRKWTVLPFRAQFIQSVDRTTYGRMLVLIPNEPARDGGTVDKWVLFAIATPDMSSTIEIKSVSIFAAHRHPGQPHTTTTYCLDFMRVKNPDGTIVPTPVVRLPFDPKHTSKNCYDCHKAAVMPIHPEMEFAFGSGGVLIEKPATIPAKAPEINRLIRTYGTPDFGVQSAAAYGPSLGPEDRERSDAFIQAASAGAGITSDSYGKIRDAMNCAMCHDKFAPINYSQAARTNRDVQAFKNGTGIVQTFIEKRLMPPNSSLTDAERRALWLCLSKEYLDLQAKSGIFIEWLKGGGNLSSNAVAANDMIYSRLGAMQPPNELQPVSSLEATYDSRKKIFGSADARTLAARDALARVLARENRLDEAEKIIKEDTSFLSVRGNPVEKAHTADLEMMLSAIYEKNGNKAKSDELRAASIRDGPTTKPSEADLPIHGF